jgi:hypothetical protein
LLLTGLVLRGLALPLDGTGDVITFKVWTYNAATLGPTHVYGAGGSPPAWRWLVYNDNTARVDYPPMALYAFAIVGRVYRAFFPAFPDGAALTATVKLPDLLAGLALATLMFGAIGRIAGAAAGQRAALAFWLNPAVMLQGAVLGYVDTLFALPAIGALIAAAFGRGGAAGALLACACLTKPQAVLVIPAVALALWRREAAGWRAIASAATVGALVTLVLVWPIVRAGAFSNMMFAVARLVTDGSLSANAANVWWLVTYAGQIMTPGLDNATTGVAAMKLVDLVSVREFLANAGADSSVFTIAVVAACAWSAVLAAVLWAVLQVRRTTLDLATLAALAAFTVHAYFTLSVQVHENHLFLALPLLAMVAATRPAYRRVLVVVSAIAALNLNLFYGFGGEAGYAIPRGTTGIDASVVLAVMNCGAFVWHAVTFRRECAARLAPVRGGAEHLSVGR